jgi:hypothetical protein
LDEYLSCLAIVVIAVIVPHLLSSFVSPKRPSSKGGFTSFLSDYYYYKQFSYTHNVTRTNKSDACRRVARKEMSFEFRAKVEDSTVRTAKGREFQIFGAAELMK